MTWAPARVGLEQTIGRRFCLTDVMLLRALPVKNPEELVEFVRVSPNGARKRAVLAPMPRASESTATVLKAGVRASMRTASPELAHRRLNDSPRTHSGGTFQLAV